MRISFVICCGGRLRMFLATAFSVIFWPLVLTVFCVRSLVAETSTGCFITANALGEKGTPAEDVGESAATQLLNELQQGGCVDEYVHFPSYSLSSMSIALPYF